MGDVIKRRIITCLESLANAGEIEPTDLTKEEEHIDRLVFLYNHFFGNSTQTSASETHKAVKVIWASFKEGYKVGYRKGLEEGRYAPRDDIHF